MPFQFQWLCELFDELNKNQHKRALSIARVQDHEHLILNNWYQRFSTKIERTGPSAVAFLSCLLPERRPDRVYNLQVKRLSQIFGRALGLGSSRALELNGWREQDGSDFATCVERTLKQCENICPHPGNEVTLEEIDEALELIAAYSPSSSPAIQGKCSHRTPTELLTPILRRLKSNEAKWFTRMLVKSYAPIQIPEFQALHGYHFLLPNLLTIQNSFEAAIQTLSKEEIRQLPARPGEDYERLLRPLISQHVLPQLGVMIKRQPYHKARSIKHCCSLAKKRLMSIERKYDGEYCQVHVDISKGHDCIQIFSKSSKDSTMDRIRLHGAIKDALRIGLNGCKIQSRCVVEGELLVWNSAKREIQPFHKIRKHLKYGGRDIGTTHDSPRSADEQLMIAFYDILVLDDNVLATKSHRIRRQYLKTVLQLSGLEGKAILGERCIIDFQNAHAASTLRKYFAKAIRLRWEGLVLKGSEEPYFDFKQHMYGIKLKKDYISQMGDVADLCIIGGRRDPQAELQIQAGSLRWTSFYIGAVTNMDAIRRFDSKPCIKVLDELTHHSMPVAEFLDLNKLATLVEVPFAPQIPEFEIETGFCHLVPPTHLFKKPFIVEVMGAGYNKPSDASFYTLRFPRKINGQVKVHTDRTLLDSMSFFDLQKMAEQSMSLLMDDDSQEDAEWIAKLVEVDGRHCRTSSLTPDTSLPKGVTSPSVISMPTASSRRAALLPIFVHPDTEELETQSIDPSISFQQTSPFPDAQQEFRSPLRVSVNSTQPKARLVNRPIYGLTDRANDDFGSKKQRRERATLKPRVDLTKIWTTRLCASAAHLDNGSSASKVLTKKPSLLGSPLCPKPFNPETTFQAFHTASMSPNEDQRSADTAVSTPDSTLLMREILATCSKGFHFPAGFSSSKALITDPRSSPSIESHPTHVSTSSTKQFPANMSHDGYLLNTAATVIVCPGSPTPVRSQQRAPPRNPFSTIPTPPTSTPTVMEIPDPKPGPATSIVVQQAQDLVTTKQATTTDLMTTQPATTQTVPFTEPSILIFPAKDTFNPATLATPASFTFSTPHFLQMIATPLISHPRYYIILIDTSSPDSIAAFADTFYTLGLHLEAHLTRTNAGTPLPKALHPFQDRILVFDLRILENREVREGGMAIEQLAKLEYGRADQEMFIGILRFSDLGEVGKVCGRDELRLRVDFDWNFRWAGLEER